MKQKTTELCTEGMNSGVVVSDLAGSLSLFHAWLSTRLCTSNTAYFSKFSVLPLILIKKQCDGNWDNDT